MSIKWYVTNAIHIIKAFLYFLYTHGKQKNIPNIKITEIYKYDVFIISQY